MVFSLILEERLEDEFGAEDDDGCGGDWEYEGAFIEVPGDMAGDGDVEVRIWDDPMEAA